MYLTYVLVLIFLVLMFLRKDIGNKNITIIIILLISINEMYLCYSKNEVNENYSGSLNNINATINNNVSRVSNTANKMESKISNLNNNIVNYNI